MDAPAVVSCAHALTMRLLSLDLQFSAPDTTTRPLLQSVAARQSDQLLFRLTLRCMIQELFRSCFDRSSSSSSSVASHAWPPSLLSAAVLAVRCCRP